MTYKEIIADWGKKIFKPVYWLEGEEEYFIDQVVDFAEHKILSESEAAFNLSVFYGKDSTWQEVVNACRRYPMSADRQVILLKEAQQMREIEKLEAYVEKPQHSTVLVVSYKQKKVDGRTKFARVLKEKGVLFHARKIYDKELPGWIESMLKPLGLSMKEKAVALLAEYIGNDLSKISMEIGKIRVNLGDRKTITEEDIEESTGISKEFNVFELQNKVAARNLPACIRILHYFEQNPKAAPIQFVLPSLYSFFSKIYMLYSIKGSDKAKITSILGVRPFFLKDYMEAAGNYSFSETERAILLLNQYNLKSVGVMDPGNSDASLLKEMIFKIMARS